MYEIIKEKKEQRGWSKFPDVYISLQTIINCLCSHSQLWELKSTRPTL